MVAKSEASMPMSRALAKLAVATDLGTAARPSTAAPVCGPGAAVSHHGIIGTSGPKSGQGSSIPLARSLGTKPSFTRSALAAMPLPVPLAALDTARAQPPPTAPPPVQSPTTPRLPPLSPTGVAAAAGGGGGASSAGVTSAIGGGTSSGAPQSQPIPKVVAPGRGARSSPAGGAAASQPVRPSPARQSLPQLPHTPTAPPRAAAGKATGAFERELADAAKHHPGLPASLLAQLYRPRGRGGAIAPASAPSGPTMTHGSVAAATSFSAMAATRAPAGAPDKPSTATDGRRLSPRARAQVTASLTAEPGAPPPPAPPAALAGLSPEALAVLLGPAPVGPPPGTASGLLVMRKAATAVSTTGVPLRPSTSAGLAAGGGALGSAAAEAVVVPPRPHVVPHITVPYKAGSIRLPPGTVPALVATSSLDAAGARPATSSTSAGGAPPAIACGSDPLRPWTSGGGMGPQVSSASRPVTANPLTHSMDSHLSGSFVVRVPRPLTSAGSGLSAAQAPTAAYTAPATAAAAGAVAADGRGLTANGGGVSELAGGLPSRKLTEEELQVVLAAVAAARPDAAALLRQRPNTAADGASRPGTASGGRRPRSTSGGSSADDLARRPGSSGEALQRPASRCGSRGRVSSSGPAAFDDIWPTPQSPRTPGGVIDGLPPASPGATATAAAAARLRTGASSEASRPAVITAWGSQRRPLQSIPEDAELADEWGEQEEEEGAGLGFGAPAGGLQALVPLEPLEPDPDLDAAWSNIVSANLRPDTAALKAATGSIDVFSRPVTGAPRVARQAAPMVLVLEDITASTPEVLERELATLSLQELQAIQAKLQG